jgi:hypothetical protein
MHQQLFGYKVEEKLYVGVSEKEKVEYHSFRLCKIKHFLDRMFFNNAEAHRGGQKSGYDTANPT